MGCQRSKMSWLYLLIATSLLASAACQGTAETTDNLAPDAATADVADVSTEQRDADPTADTTTADTGAEDGGADRDTSVDVGDDGGVDMAPSGSRGCADGAGLPEGENTFMLEGRSRRFIVRLPNGYPGDEPWPLVFALHGNGGSASYWDGTSGDRNIRGVLQDDAILIIAEAIEGNWRDYSADPSTYPARIEEELQYFDEIITRARTELCVREDAIFSMGFSGGGSFSGVLGCRRTDIRAIAVGGSVIYFDQDNCVGTPAAWITIGTQELEPPREAYRDFFRDRAGCDATTMATEPDPCVAYDNCGEGTPVHYCQHPDGHIWPDFGSEAMWAFFQQFVGSD